MMIPLFLQEKVFSYLSEKELMKLEIPEDVIFQMSTLIDLNKHKWFKYIFQKGFIKIVDWMIHNNMIYREIYWAIGFFYACEKGHQEIITLMIKKKILTDVQRSFYLHNGFHYACFGGQKEIVKLMIVMLQSEELIIDWYNALYRACSGGRQEIINLIIDNIMSVKGLDVTCDWCHKSIEKHRGMT